MCTIFLMISKSSQTLEIHSLVSPTLDLRTLSVHESPLKALMSGSAGKAKQN